MSPSAGNEIGLFVNVGQRDLQCDGQHLEAKSLRERALEIARDYASLRDRISAPMIDATLEYIRSMRGDVAYKPIVLFATDQRDPAYRGGDTIECAKLLAKRLNESLGHRLQGGAKLVSVCDRPNLYDAMYRFYQTQIAQFAKSCFGDVYLLCAGGTPACNTALILAGTIAFGERAHVLTVIPGQGVATPLAFGRQVLDTYRRSNLAQLLERRDFDGIAANPGHPEPVRELARAAAARINFDFAASYRILCALRERLPTAPPWVDLLLKEAHQLANGDEATALRDLYWNAKLKWDRGECADFLGRVWRLREAALYSEMGRICGQPLDKQGKVLKRWIEDGAQSDVQAHLAKEGLRCELNNKVLQACVDFLAVSGGHGFSDDDQRRLGGIGQITQFFEKASVLRNNSIIAHGYTGLSREVILDALEIPNSPERMFERLRELLEGQEVGLGDDPFEQYADVIAKLDENR